MTLLLLDKHHKLTIANSDMSTDERYIHNPSLLHCSNMRDWLMILHKSNVLVHES